MLTIREYRRAQSLDEAYALCQKRGNVVLGGMLWLKMQNRGVNTAIDLCGLGLDGVQETDAYWSIGAMTSLRTLETHPGLAAFTGGAMAESLRSIVGVQFRNLATVGGSLYGRFGFSDVLTLFLALGAQVQLHGAGRMPLEQFLQLPRSQKDILVRVLAPKTPCRVVYRSQRNTATDLPVLTCAVCRRGTQVVCAVGARPMPACVIEDTQGLLDGGVDEKSARAFAAFAARTAGLAGDMRAGAEYRRAVCETLVRRALLALDGEEA